jgi:uncharacterized protein DUF3182
MFCRVSRPRAPILIEGSIVPGLVLIYFSQLGGRLKTHQKVMLASDAEAIAGLKGYEFGGSYETAQSYPRPLYFVPDDTLLEDEARTLGICAPSDLFGGVVRYPFMKTKSITHPLVSAQAARPDGWSDTFAERVRDVVLPGYTAFSTRDAKTAAKELLANGPIRLKSPLGSEGKGQVDITTADQLDPALDELSREDIATYGLVIEEDLREVVTRSVGHVVVDDVTISYHGTQRLTTDNHGRSVYGGSDLTCVRGCWDALDRLALSKPERTAVTQAKLYDATMDECPGFMASRRNYDVAQGIDHHGRRRGGVLEASWRVGGATGAEVAALAALRDPSVQVIEVAHIEEYGENKFVPDGAIVHFQGNDARAGPVLRYTILRSARGS